ncbi:MAG: tyrosine-type recombinase/integrase, partial [Candidatus Omnitrophica bacterium]|nr:tyrosine-type recombinase/integrase [Candidatus Omnitrophota bacterium]
MNKRLTVMTDGYQRNAEHMRRCRQSAPVSPHDLVFCYKDGELLHPDWIIKSEFHPALTRAGLRRIRFHDLRHTYAAILVTHAVNIKVIQ